MVVRRRGKEEEVVVVVSECGPGCGCGLECGNRASQRGVEVRLKIARDKKKGWCLFADQAIEKGRFVCEYAGELLMAKRGKGATKKEYDELASSAQYGAYEFDAGFNLARLTWLEKEKRVRLKNADQCSFFRQIRAPNY
ncbi:hypothetical protein NL676_014287 [Syzygium grande]|nr:hypothetical protein NL676_014287 [Syzygium grande]